MKIKICFLFILLSVSVTELTAQNINEENLAREYYRAGSFENANNVLLSDYGLSDDPNGAFEGAVIQTNNVFGGFEWSGGTWAPYRFASHFNDGPGISSSITNLAKLENLNSVDIELHPSKFCLTILPSYIVCLEGVTLRGCMP